MKKIVATRTALEFNGATSTQQVIYTWDAREMNGVTVTYEPPAEFYVTHQITENSDLGMCVISVLSPKRPTDDASIVLPLTFDDHRGYKETFSLTISQTSTQKDKDYVIFKKNTVIVPFLLTVTDISFLELGQGKVMGVSASQALGVSATVEGKTIKIMTAWNQFVGPNDLYKKSKVTVRCTGKNAVVYYFDIDVIILTPRPIPIWKTTDIAINSTNDYVDYALYSTRNGIDIDETPLYEGRSWKMPGSDAVTFNISRICANYLSESIDPSREGIAKSFNYGRVFVLTVNGETSGAYVFYDDWTYENMNRPWTLNHIIGTPLRPVIVKGQTFIGSMWIADLQPTAEYPLISECATEDGEYFPILPPYGKFYPDGMQRTDIVLTITPTTFLPESRYVKFGGRVYRLIENCGLRYVLHYKDPEGGYVSFPVEANVNLGSRSKGYQINHRVKCPTSLFGKAKYLNETTATYEVTLPLLTKNEAGRITDITESTEVWLERLSDHRMIPVLLQGSETQLKNNENIRNYTLTFHEANNRERR